MSAISNISMGVTLTIDKTPTVTHLIRHSPLKPIFSEELASAQKALGIPVTIDNDLDK